MVVPTDPVRRAELGGHVSRRNPCHGHAHVSRKLIEPKGQTALFEAGDVELGGLGHRPSQPLIAPPAGPSPRQPNSNSGRARSWRGWAARPAIPSTGLP